LRKLTLVAAALMAMFAVTAVALAQSSPYKVTASTSPATAGSKKKPVPVSVKFGVDATGVVGRPESSARFKVGFAGLRSNGKAFKTCTAAAMNVPSVKSDSVCSSASRVGSGTVHNLAGSDVNPADTSITCDLKVTIYNSGANRAALFLKGGPGMAGASCPIPISQALDARYVSFSGGGQALQFDIPSNLIHPAPGLNNAIISINATITKKTARVKGKKVGYFEAVGGCKGGQRTLQLSLTTEAGTTTSSTGSARC
jgi:hypothetical protein